jgi:hypothetical protein
MQTPYRPLVVELRDERTTSQSRILVKGKVVPNKIPEDPDVCPLGCKKNIGPQRALLTRHHADKRIGLFYCDGCPHLLFKSLIVPTLSKAPISSDPRMESIKKKIAPLITTTMAADIKETRILEHEGPSQTAMNEDFKLLTERMNKILHTRGFDLVCMRCNEPIEVGNLYHRTGASRQTKKFYHKRCWEALLN